MKIWIEHEVWTLDQYRSLALLLWTTRPETQYNVYKPLWEELRYAFDKEYYNTQYEIKFAPFDHSVENIEIVSNYFGELYHAHESIQNKWPDFVWTHIHIFNSYSPSNSGKLEVINRVFQEMATFWKRYYADDRIAPAYKYYELKRLVTSNNLLKFLDYNIFFGAMANIQSVAGFSFQYRDIGMDRPKYAPVIWSPERWWKAFSLELRYISNTYFLLESPENIQKLVEDCVEIVTNETSSPHEDVQYYKQLKTEILKNYIILTQLLYGIQNNMSLLNVENNIRESLPLATPPATESELRLISEINRNLISDVDIFSRSNNIWREERWMRRRDEEESSDDWWGDVESSDEEEGS